MRNNGAQNFLLKAPPIQKDSYMRTKVSTVLGNAPSSHLFLLFGCIHVTDSQSVVRLATCI